MSTWKISSWSVFKAHIDELGFLLEPLHKIMLTFAKSFCVLLSNSILLLLGFLFKRFIRLLFQQNDLCSSVDLDPNGFSKEEGFPYFLEFHLQSSSNEKKQEQKEEIIFSKCPAMAISGNEISNGFLEPPENSDYFDVVNFSCKETPFLAASHGNETNEQDLRSSVEENDSDLMGMIQNRERTELGTQSLKIYNVGEEEESCGLDQNPFPPKWGFEEVEQELECGQELQDQNPFPKWGFEEQHQQSCGQNQNPFPKWGFKESSSSCGEHQNPLPKWEFEEEEEEEDEDILMEHKELVEQMKMEAKNARGGGLPTIMEEEMETPLKIADDLKPLRIEEERLQYKDQIEEIHKVYRSYLEKMKKLDIFNYQTIQAISFLKMKDPTRHFPSIQKSPSSTVKSLMIPSRWPNKIRRIRASDPTLKSMAKLHRDLEAVYVGQACLSWEILKWQYEKAIELSKNNEGQHQPKTYNQTACEFQQFQILVHRFVENEGFQAGTRIQNYARERSSIRALLHVPVVKDDSFKEMKLKQGMECNWISIAKLIDILEESMRVFWEFIRADKYDNFLVRIHRSGVDQIDLLEELNTTLQRKNRRLKDIIRSRKCIVKKLIQKQKFEQGRALDCNQLLAQVELKLVGRALSMSKGLTFDQLAWCQKKLNKVTFPNGKVQLEPTFWLFPAV